MTVDTSGERRLRRDAERNRKLLLDAAREVFADLGDVMGELGERVLRIEDPWDALVTYAEGLCALTATDRGVCDLVMSGFPEPPEMAEGILDTVRELVARMQRRGCVRPDITLVDVQTAICSVLLMIPASITVDPNAWHRHLTLTLDGLRSPARSVLPAPSLTEEQFHQISLRLFPAMNVSRP